MAHTHVQDLALQHNNRGAFFIATRRYSNAISCLSQGLQQTKQLLKGADKEDRREDSIALVLLDQFMCQDPGQIEMMTSVDSAKSSDTDFVYRHPISIPSSQFHALIPDENDCKVVISLSIIFNLALAHHLRAIEEVDASSNHQELSRAMRLYELAYKLQAHGDTGSGISTLYIMSTLNNLGQIHKALNEADTASKCFENLLSAMMFTVHTGGTLPEQALDGFMRNMTQSVLRTPCAGAAWRQLTNRTKKEELMYIQSFDD